LGLKDFLLPKEVSSLRQAARLGPIVIINIHERRCDALILESGKDDVGLVSLEKLGYERVKQMQHLLHDTLHSLDLITRNDLNRHLGSQLGTESSGLQGALSFLFEAIVQPVLGKLGYLASVVLYPR
jgi:hypothetical protein